MTFAEFYDESYDRVLRFFALRVGARGEAEDLTQAAFERALRAWDRFDPARASATTWVLAIARNLVIDQARASGRRPRAVALEAALDVPDPHPTEPDLGIDPALSEALAQLDDRARELLALRFGADLAAADIAGATGLSLANVQQILSRSLRSLRDLLDAGGGGSGSERPGADGPGPGEGEQH